MPEELSAFLTVTFKGPLSPDRRKLLDSYPRPTSTALSPPGLDKSMMPLIQKKKSVIAHDRFLSKLQRFTMDAMGPLSYLLAEVLSGKDVPKEKAISALQASICLIGNASVTLSVERRRCILRQLNPKLTSLAEEDFDNDGKLFGDNFGKRAKERMDAIRSLASSSSVFFDWATPLQHPGSDRALGVAKKALSIGIPHTSKKGQSGESPAFKAGPTPRSRTPTQLQTRTDIQSVYKCTEAKSVRTPNSKTIQPASDWLSARSISEGTTGAPGYSGRTAAIFCDQLGDNILRSLDYGNHKRFQNTSATTTSPASVSPSHFIPVASGSSRCRTGKTPGKGNYCTDRGTSPSNLPFTNLYHPKEKRGASIDFKSQGPKQVYSKAAFQDGRSTSAGRFAAIRGLDDESGPKGCLLCGPNPSGQPTLAQFPLGRQAVQIYMPPLWPVLCSSYLYESSKTCGSLSEEERNSANYLHRRHPHNGSVTSSGPSAPCVSSGCIGASGISGELPKVHLGADSEDRIFGIHARARYSRAGKTRKNGCRLEAVINIPDFLV